MDSWDDDAIKSCFTEQTESGHQIDYKVLHHLANGRYGDVLKVQLMTNPTPSPNPQNASNSSHSTDPEDADQSNDDLNTNNTANQPTVSSAAHSDDDRKDSNDSNDSILAMKAQQIFDGEITSKLQREIDILTTLKSEDTDSLHIIELVTHFVDGGHLLFVMPFYDSNLSDVLESAPLNQDTIKHFMFQILGGLSYIHSKGIIHRDVKPNNILLCTQRQHLVITDFGSARDITHLLELDSKDDGKENENEIEHDPQRDNPNALTPQIYVVMYRAPELLLGERNYRFPVDIWAAGCIMAQMVRSEGKMLFDKDHDIPLFMQQLEILGGPEQGALDGVGLFSVFFQMEPKPAKAMRTVLGEECDAYLNGHGYALLAELLCLGPKQRITAEVALNHSYFEEVDNENDEPKTD